jgi:hypothetical protein
MKTRNSKLQKTDLTLTFTFVLVALMVSLNLKSKAAVTGLSTAAFITVEHDASLEIESWMLNESNFFMVVNMEETAEAVMEIENWMTDANFLHRRICH